MFRGTRGIRRTGRDDVESRILSERKENNHALLTPRKEGKRRLLIINYGEFVVVVEKEGVTITRIERSFNSNE